MRSVSSGACLLILLVRLPWSRNRYANGFGALPLLLPLLFVVQALRMPLINDVSTDPYNPPAALGGGA